MGTPIAVRLPVEAEGALDAAAAAEPDRPSRSELIRRIVTGWLARPTALERTPDRIAAMEAQGASARSHAATTADEEMLSLDSIGDEKGDRRRALTEEPSIVADAKAQVARRGRI